jgi:hypothetical protein
VRVCRPTLRDNVVGSGRSVEATVAEDAWHGKRLARGGPAIKITSRHWLWLALPALLAGATVFAAGVRSEGSFPMPRRVEW